MNRGFADGGPRRSGVKAAFFLCSLTAALGCQAQAVHKCVKGGSTTYQSTPCDGAAVSAPVAATIPPSSGGLPWEGLRPGMSLEDVKRLVPDLESSMGDGKNQSAVRKREVKVAGFSFAARYAFERDKGLKSVLFEHVGDEKVMDLELSRNANNLAAFEKLTQFLRGKYGAEATRELKTKETGFPGLSATSEWMVDGGRLFVVVLPVTAETSMLNVGMQYGAGGRR